MLHERQPDGAADRPLGERIEQTTNDQLPKEVDPAMTERLKDLYRQTEAIEQAMLVLQKLSTTVRPWRKADGELWDYIQRAWPVVEKSGLTAENYLVPMLAMTDTGLDESANWYATGPRLYDQAVAKALPRVEQRYQSAVHQASSLIGTVFPEGLAEVHTPSWCRPLIPVSRWQYQNGFTASQQADRAYSALCGQARQRACRQFSQSIPETVELTPDRSDMDAIHQYQSDSMQALYQQLSELGARAEPIAKARLLRSPIGITLRQQDRDRLHALCDYIITQGPVIRKLRTSLQKKFGRTDVALVDELAEVLTDRLWSRPAIQQLQTVLQYQVEQAIAESIEWLAEQLELYQHSEQPPTQLGSDQIVDGCVEPTETSLQVVERSPLPTTLRLPDQAVPWLSNPGPLSVLDIKEYTPPGVLVLDCRTPELMAIEQTMTGYETDQARQGLVEIVQTRLAQLARIAATPKGLMGASSVGRLHVGNSPYKERAIWYNKRSKAHNVVRVYAAEVLVEHLADLDDATRQHLQTHDIHRLLLFVGACDKQHQIEALQYLTGFSRPVLAGRGAGSV